MHKISKQSFDRIHVEGCQETGIVGHFVWRMKTVRNMLCIGCLTVLIM